MLEHMRRLHPRSAANRGICVDAEGAMLGPHCVLVNRSVQGYRGIGRDEAAALQAAFLDDYREPDWLFRQARRIADALDKSEIALAQIYGLRIPIGVLDDRQLKRLATAHLAKTGFNPDEPRLPKGDPHGGEWTTGGDEESASAPSTPAPDTADYIGDGGGGDDGVGGGDDGGGNGGPSTGPGETAPNGTAPADDARSAQERSMPDGSPNEDQPDPNASFEMSPPDAAAPDHPSPPSENPNAPGSPAESISPTGDQNSQTNQSVPTDNSADGKLPGEWTIAIPDEAPTSTQQINALLRSIATWLGRTAAILGAAAYALDPEVEIALAAIEGAAWLADYLPKIWSYLDAPKTLEELQNAVDDPRFGYEIHHIVEAQPRSDKPERNSLRFSDRINSPENLVRVPYWKHVEISSWYSRPNDDYGDLSPRDFLRGKSWEEQYQIGIDALRKFGVLK